MLTALLLILAQNQEPNAEVWVRPPRVERIQRAGGRRGAGFAFFEAFPASGAGTTGVCSTTAPTGAKGEALTFTRASTAICTKTAAGGLATTGIANGDLVSLSSNVIRQEYDANGVLGVRVEESRTNHMIRNAELDNAHWTKFGGGVSAPSVVSASNTDPLGTTTADRVSFAACAAAGNQSIIFNSTGGSGLAGAFSIYARAVSGSASISLCSSDGATGSCTACSLVDSSWRRCVHTTVAANQFYAVFGCNNNGAYTGASNTGAADVYLWNIQSEVGTFPTSPIPTTSATVTRSLDALSLDLGANAPPGDRFSAAVTKEGVSDLQSPSGAAWLMLNPVSTTDGSGKGLLMYGPSNFQRCRTANDAAVAFSTGAIAGTANNTPQRWSCWSASDANGNYKGTALSASGATSGTFSAARYVNIGSASLANVSGGIYTRVCVDPEPTRCR